MAGLLTLPPLLVHLGPGVDPSWVIGLHLAALKGLGFGKEVVVPDGPLGYLSYPAYVDGTLYWRAVVALLGAHFLLVLSLFVLMNRLVDWGLLRCLLFLLTVYFFVPFFDLSYKVSLSVLILLFMFLTKEIRRKAVLALISFGVAIGMLMKFSSAVVMSAFVLIACVYLWVEHRRAAALFLAAGSTLCFVFLWVVSSGHDSSLAGYVKGMLTFTASYSEDWSLSGPVRDVLLALLSLAGGVSLVLSGFWQSDDVLRSRLAAFSFLSLPLVYVSFRHGFVRHDAPHGLLILSTLGVLYILLAVLFGWRQKVRGAGALLLASTMVVAMAPWGLKDRIDPRMVVARLGSLGQAAMLLKGGGREFQVQEKQRLQAQLPLSMATRDLIQRADTDLVPPENSLVYAYDLPWKGGVFVQSYYARKLDASLFEDNASAPSFVLFSFRSVDWRYPLFDRPEALRFLLCRYRPLGVDGEFVLLQRQAEPRCLPEKFIGAVEGEVGNVFTLPDVTDGFLIARLRVELSPLGKLMKLLYKLPPAEIVLMEKETCRGARYRFIRARAAEGLLLSGHLKSNRDVLGLFDGVAPEALIGVSIRVWNSFYYKNRMQVEFYSLPMIDLRTTHRMSYPSRVGSAAASLDSYRPMEASNSGHVDMMKGLLSEADGSRVGKRDCLILAGWAADPTTQKPASDVLVVADGKILTRAHALGILRVDVAGYFNNPSLKYSGWQAGFPVSSLPAISSVIEVYAVLSDGRSIVRIPNPHFVLVNDVKYRGWIPVRARK